MAMRYESYDSLSHLFYADHCSCLKGIGFFVTVTDGNVL